MDIVRGFEDDRIGTDHDATDGGGEEPRIDIGGDERRMHVRAYNHWVSLLRGRAYPSIEDLDPVNIADFGPHSVLLDFSGGVENPKISFLGRALREECGLDSSTTHIAQVPSRSLLSRLTDHYLQIIANRAPIGFEAEFVASRGLNTLYRGILMPFSSDDEGIDFIYGVINWKELVNAETQARLDAEVDAAVRSAPKPAASAPVWADGPSAGIEPVDDEGEVSEGASLTDRLAAARESAAAVHAADTRSRTTLYRALGRAHDFAHAAKRDPAAYAGLLAEAGIAVQARAPMTPVVKLVFGTDYDKTRLTEFAAVLSYAERHAVPAGALGGLLDAFEGGIKAMVSAERAHRAPAPKPAADPAAALRARPALASVTLDTQIAAGDYVVLLARATAEGTLDIVAALGGDSALTRQAMRRAAS